MDFIDPVEQEAMKRSVCARFGDGVLVWLTIGVCPEPIPHSVCPRRHYESGGKRWLVEIGVGLQSIAPIVLQAYLPSAYRIEGGFEVALGGLQFELHERWSSTCHVNRLSLASRQDLPEYWS